MNDIIKQSIIIIGSFFLILWFQEQDDNKAKRIRKTLFDKYKVPVIVCSIIGLFLNLDLNKNILDQFLCKEDNSSKIDLNIPSKDLNISSGNLTDSFKSDNLNSNILKPNILKLNNLKQDIYTELPPF